MAGGIGVTPMASTLGWYRLLNVYASRGDSAMQLSVGKLLCSVSLLLHSSDIVANSGVFNR